MTTHRLKCLVPFCGSTRGIRKGETKLPAEWICANHWRHVDAKAKRMKSWAERAARSASERMKMHFERTGCHDWDLVRASAHANARFERSWARCKRQAIERAAGI